MGKMVGNIADNKHWESCPHCKSKGDLILSRTPIDSTNPNGYIQYRMYCRKCNLTTNLYSTEGEAVDSWNEYAVQVKHGSQELTDQERVLMENPYLQPDWADQLVSQDSQYRLIQLHILCDGFNRIVKHLSHLCRQVSSMSYSIASDDQPQDPNWYLHQAMEAQRRKQKDRCKKDAD